MSVSLERPLLAPTEITDSGIDPFWKRVSNNPAKLLVCATLALQAIEAPILDKLIQDILSIQVLYTSKFSSSSSSLVLPHTLIEFSVLEVCINLAQIISSMALLRKFSINMLHKEFGYAKKEKDENACDGIEIYSNKSPIYIWHFVAYAASAMFVLITSSTLLANVLSKMESDVVFQTSSGSGHETEVKMGMIVNQTMVRCFGALSIFSLKHVILAACGILKLWDNKVEVIKGMRIASAVEV